MKVIAAVEKLGLMVTMAAVLAKDTLVKLTANETVNKADANAIAIGRVSVVAKEAGGKGTVESFFSSLIEIKGVGACPFGSWVKLGAPDGTTGENTAVPWVLGTDDASLRLGLVFKGGTNVTLKVLIP